MERMFEIIKILGNDERPTIDSLAQDYECSTRTIRRDIKEIAYFNGASIDKKTGQILLLEGSGTSTTKLMDDELLITELAFSAIKNVGVRKNIQHKINAIRQKISYPKVFSPYLIKAELFEEINVDRELLNKIEDSIKCKNVATVIGKEASSKIEPYKVVAFDGIWYLFAKDLGDKKIKTYMLSQILNFRASLETYDVSTKEIHQMLDGVHSAWFEDGNSFEVTVKVKPEIAYLFKLKKHLSSQKTKKELKDGSLVLSFQVSTDEDIDNLIKAWLPHIEVIKPNRFRKKLLNELEGYVASLKQVDISIY